MHLQLHSTSLLQFRWGCAVVLILFKLAESFQSTSIYVYTVQRAIQTLSLSDCLAGMAGYNALRSFIIRFWPQKQFISQHWRFFPLCHIYPILYAIMLYTLFFSLCTYIHLHKYPVCFIILFYFICSNYIAISVAMQAQISLSFSFLLPLLRWMYVCLCHISFVGR